MSSSRYKTVVVMLGLVVQAETLRMSKGGAFVVLLLVRDWREGRWLGR